MSRQIIHFDVFDRFYERIYIGIQSRLNSMYLDIN